MSNHRRAFVLLIAAATLSAGSAAWAQAPPTPTVPDAVLGRIPAGCMGFLAVNNVQQFTGKIDAFVQLISPQGQPLLPMPVLELIKAQLQLGEGFDPNGGFAAVMLDPQQYGLDLVGAITGTNEKPVNWSDVPAVFLIPGKDPAKVLAAAQPVKEGEDYKLTGMGDPPGWSRQVGNYVLLSPNRKALAAVAGSTKPVLTELSAADKAMILSNDAAVWLNFRVVGPILDAAMGRIEKEAAEVRKRTEGGAPGPRVGKTPAGMMMLGMADAIPLWRQMLKQVEDVTFAARVPKSGIILQGRVSHLPDSAMGKVLAAYKPLTAPLLHRLPNMPYVLAGGGHSGPKLSGADQAKQLDQMMAMEPFKSVVSPEVKAKLRELALAGNEEFESSQIYVGANAVGTSRLAGAVVMRCKSADKARQMFADAVAVMAEIFKTSKEAELRKLSVKYLKEAETLGDRKVDVITVDHPELTEAPDEARRAMTSLLGEARIRAFVTAVDAKTLVLTMGGKKEFLAAALKTAAGGGRLEADPNVAKALVMMPPQRAGVVVFSAKNLVDLIMGVMKDMAGGEGQQMMPLNLRIDSAVPFAAAMGFEKTDAHMTAYLPTETIRDLVKMFMGMMMPMAPPPGGDF